MLQIQGLFSHHGIACPLLIVSGSLGNASNHLLVHNRLRQNGDEITAGLMFFLSGVGFLAYYAIAQKQANKESGTDQN